MTESGQRLVLAFDFGTRRIGVAVGNEMLNSARELAPLTARDGIPDWELVTRLVKEWQPDLFVVGLPLNMDGTESAMSLRARKFGNRLHGRFGKPCEMVDERGSTQEAKHIARAAGHRGNYREESVDGIAAVLILEGWFAHQEGLPGGRISR
ncbi:MULTISPECIES: Holliday junction resolvase RuvX [Halomonadaceae]|jgi:putative Holliday junction resolvase|uniref:Putative pre-16S rRNA nuclease n=1 Tax=Vreelandella janggokensis TaxID=370767 RepID=A0ABT4IXH5_9GAMM|nr:MULTISPECIES: Holliday junction resolvase RuvX [Halomonas]MCW4150972.1 Holliday junction resolvase RuvX [Halomonas sp. 18H]MCZ0927697.1 Holliday junction resolvase RuvX [Halomonas janggokensis]MCZ0930205.1 Holliday junction resolvase RuvX [Halomonas janggokensis]MDR5885661.1 Holliday junction resolvase RuvX [Halomonas janggokensis]QPL46299.1 Holliday junction resolvase RuvX [Halomonas sp. A40-4]